MTVSNTYMEEFKGFINQANVSGFMLQLMGDNHNFYFDTYVDSFIYSVSDSKMYNIPKYSIISSSYDLRLIFLYKFTFYLDQALEHR